LVPSTTNIEHDHTYASKADEAEGQIFPWEDTSNEGVEVEENDEEPDDESDKHASRTDECVQSIYARKLVNVTSLCISGKEQNLEKLTRQQSDKSLWYEPFEATPKLIEWGRRNEPLAREAYVK